MPFCKKAQKNRGFGTAVEVLTNVKRRSFFVGGQTAFFNIFFCRRVSGAPKFATKNVPSFRVTVFMSGNLCKFAVGYGYRNRYTSA